MPRLDIAAVIAEGTTPRTLRRAVGSLSDSAPPGSAGNVALAAHRDSFFRPLEGVREGDEILVETAVRVDRYLVEWMQVVEPTRVDVIFDAGYPALTLITCYPFRYLGEAPLRFVVRARRVSSHPVWQGEDELETFPSKEVVGRNSQGSNR